MGVVSFFLDLLYPPKCMFCHKLLESADPELTCPECRASLPRTSGGGRQKGDFFSFCVSPLFYEEHIRDAVHRLKFSSCSGYADAFGRLVAECVSEYIEESFDLLTWASVSAKRLKERGYDQARLIAEAVARELGTTAVRTLKKRNVPAQSTVGAEAKRRANIAGAYSVCAPEAVNGKTILLIDDVITTGSTLSECSRMLRMAGAEKVICASAARARE